MPMFHPHPLLGPLAQGLPLSSPPQNCMNLPPDKVQLLSQYDNEKKWELICDQVGTRTLLPLGLPALARLGLAGEGRCQATHRTRTLPRGQYSIWGGCWGAGGICGTLESPSLGHGPPQGPYES